MILHYFQVICTKSQIPYYYLPLYMCSNILSVLFNCLLNLDKLVCIDICRNMSSQLLDELLVIPLDVYSNIFVLASRTPFHADVFRSYSWSANICGRKKWLLYPPGQEEFLRDCHGNLAYDVTALVLQDKGLYAQFEEACQPLEIIQEAGEIIFVPSGWHHQVYNLVSNNGLMVSKYVRCTGTGVSNPGPGGPMPCTVLGGM